jgi:hypothetical protein
LRTLCTPQPARTPATHAQSSLPPSSPHTQTPRPRPEPLHPQTSSAHLRRTAAVSVIRLTAALSTSGRESRMRLTAALHPPHFMPPTSSTSVSAGPAGRAGGRSGGWAGGGPLRRPKAAPCTVSQPEEERWRQIRGRQCPTWSPLVALRRQRGRVREHTGGRAPGAHALLQPHAPDGAAALERPLRARRGAQRAGPEEGHRRGAGPGDGPSLHQQPTAAGHAPEPRGAHHRHVGTSAGRQSPTLRSNPSPWGPSGSVVACQGGSGCVTGRWDGFFQSYWDPKRAIFGPRPKWTPSTLTPRAVIPTGPHAMHGVHCIALQAPRPRRAAAGVRQRLPSPPPSPTSTAAFIVEVVLPHPQKWGSS